MPKSPISLREMPPRRDQACAGIDAQVHIHDVNKSRLDGRCVGSRLTIAETTMTPCTLTATSVTMNEVFVFKATAF